jgi:hypothetical protein
MLRRALITLIAPLVGAAVVRRVEVTPSVLSESKTPQAVTNEVGLGSLQTVFGAKYDSALRVSFFWSASVYAEFLRHARNGLIFVGSSEARRMYVAAVAMLMNMTTESYLHQQSLAARNYKTALQEGGLHHITADARVHFFWIASFNSKQQWHLLNSSMRECANPTLFVSAPLSHSLWYPLRPWDFFVKDPSDPSLTIDAMKDKLSLLVDNFLTELTDFATPWLNGSTPSRFLKLGLGHPYCSKEFSNMLEDTRFSGDVLQGRMKTGMTLKEKDELEELRQETRHHGGCFAGDDAYEYSWKSPCDYFLQSNDGMKHANDIVREVAINKRFPGKIVDMYELGMNRSVAIDFAGPWNTGVECSRTHWPHSVILDQLRAIFSEEGSGSGRQGPISGFRTESQRSQFKQKGEARNRIEASTISAARSQGPSTPSWPKSLPQLRVALHSTSGYNVWSGSGSGSRAIQNTI